MRRRAAIATAAAGALVLVAAGAALVGRGTQPVRVAVDAGAVGRPVPRGFLGLSTEWTSVEPFAGPARPGVVGLMRRLRAATGSPIPLRIGGASAEEAWWNPAGRPRPPTVLHDLGPGTLRALGRLARDLDAPVTVGLNLSLGDTANALALARAARSRLGIRLEAFEIGNEPDLYTAARTTGPIPVRRLRKRVGYDPAAYARDAGRLLTAVRRGIGPRPRLVAGGLAGSPAWVAALPALVDRHRAEIGAISAHRYGLARCELRPGDPAGLRDRLLSGDTRASLRALTPLIAMAHRRGLPLWMGELNSAPCGGAPGVSDTFAAALWLADALFTLVSEGADRAEVHTWDGAVYAPFERRAGTASPRPPFFGMLAFARAAPSGSRLVRVRLTGGGAVRAWGTRDRAGTVRLALLSTGEGGSSQVRVAAGDRRGCATLRVIGAPSLAAGDGIAETAPRRHCPKGGVVAFGLPGPSAAVLELPA